MASSRAQTQLSRASSHRGSWCLPPSGSAYRTWEIMGCLSILQSTSAPWLGSQGSAPCLHSTALSPQAPQPSRPPTQRAWQGKAGQGSHREGWGSLRARLQEPRTQARLSGSGLEPASLLNIGLYDHLPAPEGKITAISGFPRPPWGRRTNSLKSTGSL